MIRNLNKVVLSASAALAFMFVGPAYSQDFNPEDVFSEEVTEEISEDSYEGENIEGDFDFEIEHLDDLSVLNQCYRFSSNPRQCNRIYGCQYSRIYSQCVPATGPNQPNHPSPQPNYCSRYHYNYSQCVQARCLFDGSSGACYSGNGGGGGGGGQNFWTCTAVDSGWEEHRGGHVGRGRSRFQAENQAIAECNRDHGRCRITQCRQGY